MRFPSDLLHCKIDGLLKLLTDFVKMIAGLVVRERPVLRGPRGLLEVSRLAAARRIRHGSRESGQGAARVPVRKQSEPLERGVGDLEP